MFCLARRFHVLFGFGFGEHLFGFQNKCFVRALEFVIKTFAFGEHLSGPTLQGSGLHPDPGPGLGQVHVQV